jgi:hypothetical protein
MKPTQEQKLVHSIVQKAWSDNKFKNELLANPLEAIQQLAGKQLKLPEGKSIVVQDQSDSSIIFINIPTEPDMDDMELNEDQLEYIAGGGDPLVAVMQIVDDQLDGLL